MNVKEIIDKARRLAYTNKDEYTDINGLNDLNSVYQGLVSSIITEVGEDYFFDVFTTDLVYKNNEYSFEVPTSEKAGMNKIKEIYIKYSDDSRYNKAKYVPESTMQFTPFELAKTQPKNAPIYNIAENSVFIYPEPDKNVLQGLKASVSITPRDLTLDDLEGSIRIPRQYHDLLVFGLVFYTYMQRGLIQEANNSKQLFEVQKREFIRELSDRDLSPLETSIPILSHLE